MSFTIYWWKMVKLKYKGSKNDKVNYTFSLFGKKWYDGQELTPEEVTLLKNINLGDWALTQKKTTPVVEEVVEEVEEIKEEVIEETKEELPQEEDEEEIQ